MSCRCSGATGLHGATALLGFWAQGCDLKCTTVRCVPRLHSSPMGALFLLLPSCSLSSHPQLTFMIAATYNFAVLKLMGRGTKF